MDVLIEKKKCLEKKYDKGNRTGSYIDTHKIFGMSDHMDDRDSTHE